MTREEIIKSLNEIHGSFIEKAYLLNVLEKILKLPWDSYLAEKFRKDRVPGLPSDFFCSFKINSWKVYMETEEDDI